MKLILSFFLIIVCCLSIHAQSEKKHIREGNKLYEKEKYADAEVSYLKALDQNTNSYQGAFNLGDASYKQGKYEEAAKQFEILAHNKTDKNTVAKAYHNLGNALLKGKKYEKSIDAYKNALRNNPKDEDTRYNLAYALEMMKQQQQQDQKNKDQKNKDQKKEKQEKKQNQQEQKQQEQKQQEQKQQQKKQDQQQKPQPDQLSKEDAKRLLDALKNEEMDVQEKLKKKKVKVQNIKIEKDW